jgi:lyso-ornithine lipid O-acyltransferase
MKTTNAAWLTLRCSSAPLVSGEAIRWKVRRHLGEGLTATKRFCALSMRLSLALLRSFAFLLVAVLAVADAIVTRIVAVPTGAGMARARAEWLHRWSRRVRRVLGVKVEQRGVMPPSGIITANCAFFLDAVLLAAVRPCVFVVGAKVRQWPVIGLLAKLGGTLFVDRRRRADMARVNFLVERAIRRRVLVVILFDGGAPEVGGLNSFASGLLEPAVGLGCTLTAATFAYQAFRGGEHPRMCITRMRDLLRPFAQLFGQWRPTAIGAFHNPVFHHGDRKQLARQLGAEAYELNLRIAPTGWSGDKVTA